MKRNIYVLLATAFLFTGVLISCDLERDNTNPNDDAKHEIDTNGEIKSGDLIFHTSKSSQSKAIQIATKSNYSHCGIIYLKNKELFVFEAIDPVQLTPFSEWINRGYRGPYVIKRVKNAAQILTQDRLKKMKKIGDAFKGRKYDGTFEWSDQRMYCSELIWKIYKRAVGIEIGKPQKLREFDLSNELVKQKIKDRYNGKVPLEDTVISPAAIFESELLETVFSN
ncbi:MAG: YiiX family permuted papain-like enzyme [Cryomorphaceae bacterium]|nr:YiiX family permuted papain-like enzyme [Cryomorphaceae bacterium]